MHRTDLSFDRQEQDESLRLPPPAEVEVIAAIAALVGARSGFLASARSEELDEFSGIVETATPAQKWNLHFSPLFATLVPLPIPTSVPHWPDRRFPGGTKVNGRLGKCHNGTMIPLRDGLCNDMGHRISSMSDSGDSNAR